MRDPRKPPIHHGQEMKPGLAPNDALIWMCANPDCTITRIRLSEEQIAKLESPKHQQHLYFRQKTRRGYELQNRGRKAVRGETGCLRVLGTEVRGEPRPARQSNTRMAVIGGGGHFYNPAKTLATAINDALDPLKAPKKVRTLQDMSPEEKAAIEAKYGCRIRKEA